MKRSATFAVIFAPVGCYVIAGISAIIFSNPSTLFEIGVGLCFVQYAVLWVLITVRYLKLLSRIGARYPEFETTWLTFRKIINFCSGKNDTELVERTEYVRDFAKLIGINFAEIAVLSFAAVLIISVLALF